MLKVLGKTNINLDQNDIEVNNILYVPELAANLLSVKKIVDKGNTVLFNKEGCSIFNNNDQIIANCKPRNGVYKFKSDAEKCFISTANDSILWHRR